MPIAIAPGNAAERASHSSSFLGERAIEFSTNEKPVNSVRRDRFIWSEVWSTSEGDISMACIVRWLMQLNHGATLLVQGVVAPC